MSKRVIKDNLSMSHKNILLTAIGNDDLHILSTMLSKYYITDELFDEIIFRSNEIYEFNPRCYEYIINYIEKNNDIFNIFVSSIKKYNINDNILQIINKYFEKCNININIIDSYLADNYELMKKIFKINKTLNINVAFPSRRHQTETIPFLYYLVKERCNPNVLEYFLKIGCDPNIRFKHNDRYYDNLRSYDELKSYESLLNYALHRTTSKLNEQLIDLIIQYGGKISEEGQMYYYGKIIFHD